jgi:hypothetical protein
VKRLRERKNEGIPSSTKYFSPKKPFHCTNTFSRRMMNCLVISLRGRHGHFFLPWVFFEVEGRRPSKKLLLMQSLYLLHLLPPLLLVLKEKRKKKKQLNRNRKLIIIATWKKKRIAATKRKRKQLRL